MKKAPENCKTEVKLCPPPCRPVKHSMICENWPSTLSCTSLWALSNFLWPFGAFETENVNLRGHFRGHLRVHSRVRCRERVRGSHFAVRMLCAFLIHSQARVKNMQWSQQHTNPEIPQDRMAHKFDEQAKTKQGLACSIHPSLSTHVGKCRTTSGESQ